MSQAKLLILDLDETLIHALATTVRAEADFHVFHYFVYKRPGEEVAREKAAFFRRTPAIVIWLVDYQRLSFYRP